MVGQASWVKDVCLSGRVFGGEEAGRVGFCGWVGGEGREGVLGEALRWAGVVVGKSPVAVQGTKEILDWSRDRSVEDGTWFPPFFFPLHLLTFFDAFCHGPDHPPSPRTKFHQKTSPPFC